MKIPIAISVLILAVAAGLGWKIEQRLTVARMDERRLAVVAKRLGVSGGVVGSDRSAKRVRADLDAEARKLAVEYNTEARKWESVAMMGIVIEARYVEIHRQIEALDSARLKAFITDVLTDQDFPGCLRKPRRILRKSTGSSKQGVNRPRHLIIDDLTQMPIGIFGMHHHLQGRQRQR